MRFGRTVEKGALAVYSVDTEEEARKLLTVACPRSYTGEFIASELVEEQTIENLAKFSDRLHAAHELIAKNARQSPLRSPRKKAPASRKYSRAK